MPKRSSSSPEVTEVIASCEAKADSWAKARPFFHRSWNIAAWGGLSACALVEENMLAGNKHGSAAHYALTMNLARTAYQMYLAAKENGQQESVVTGVFQWRGDVAEMQYCLNQASSYVMFCNAFPLWHNDQSSVEIISANCLRFTSELTPRAERFLAFEKGSRPKHLTELPEDPPLQVSLHFDLALQQTFRTLHARGTTGFAAPLPVKLHDAIYKWYLEQTVAHQKRQSNLEFGAYRLTDFQKCFAALASIAFGRRALCRSWADITGNTPIDNLVVVHQRPLWESEIRRLSGCDEANVASFIEDLTLVNGITKEFAVTPFVPLDEKQHTLAVVPCFVLMGNPEEKLARDLSFRDAKRHNTNSSKKEDALIEALRKTMPGLVLHGPWILGAKLPDIDLIFEDSTEDHLLICELKWLQLPHSTSSRKSRTEDLKKGVRQIEQIRSLLEQHPSFLVERGRMTRTIDSFAGVDYCVLSRDFVTEVDDYPAIYSLEAFEKIMAKGARLSEAVKYLASYDWLPVRGVDYEVPFVSHECAGVTVEQQMIVPSPGSLSI